MLEELKAQHKENRLKLEEYDEKMNALYESNKKLEKGILNLLIIYPVGSVVKFKGVHLKGEYKIDEYEFIDTDSTDYFVYLRSIGPQDIIKPYWKRIKARITKEGETDQYGANVFNESVMQLVEGATVIDNKVVRTIPKKKRGQLELPHRVAENVYLVEQEILPSQENGINWGVDRKVIAKKGSKYLFWVKGQRAWSGIGQTSYYEGHLSFIDKDNLGRGIGKGMGKDLHKAGTHLRKAIVAGDEQIRELLGIDFSIAEVYKPNTTILVKE